MSDIKPRRVKARITRTVTEVAIVLLDKNGFIEEFEETHEELFSENEELIDIREVLSEHY